MADRGGYLRIGELARRTGVKPDLLRAWEQRYGLLQPSRSEGGFRLYTDLDERRVRRTAELISGGLSAGEAARMALTGDVDSAVRPQDAAQPLLQDLAGWFAGALDRLDGESANATFDALLATFSVEVVLRDVVLAYLRDLGDRWATGGASVAQEHFASNIIRGRLMGLARGWGAGSGPSVVLACPPGEAHEFGLIIFGIAVARRGWRVTFLGADTPIASVQDAVRSLQPALVVLAVSTGERARAHARSLRELASLAPVALGGAIGAEEAAELGVQLLPGDPIEAARSVAA